jgi:hypothetical protein
MRVNPIDEKLAGRFVEANQMIERVHRQLVHRERSGRTSRVTAYAAEATP